MAARGFEGSTDAWCNGDSNSLYYYIISGWIPTQNISMLRSSLKRRNKTSAFTVALVWRLAKETTEDPAWAASPDANTISSGDSNFEEFFSATTAIAEYRFCQFALKVYNHTGSAFNIGQIEYSVELRSC